MFHTVSYSATRLACVLVGSESVCSIRFTRCEQPATPTFTAQSASPYSGNYERKLSLDAAPTVVSSGSERSAEYYAVFRSVHRPTFFFKAVSLERKFNGIVQERLAIRQPCQNSPGEMGRYKRTGKDTHTKYETNKRVRASSQNATLSWLVVLRLSFLTKRRQPPNNGLKIRE